MGGGIFPKADHIYRFSPPRSQHFWNAAYKMELMLNLLVPLFCVLAHQVVNRIDEISMNERVYSHFLTLYALSGVYARFVTAILLGLCRDDNRGSSPLLPPVHSITVATKVAEECKDDHVSPFVQWWHPTECSTCLVLNAVAVGLTKY